MTNEQDRFATELDEDIPPPRFYAIRDHKGNLVPHEQAVAMQRKQALQQRLIRDGVGRSIAELQASRDAGEIAEAEYREQRETMESIHASLAPDVPGRRGVVGIVQASIENLWNEQKP